MGIGEHRKELCRHVFNWNPYIVPSVLFNFKLFKREMELTTIKEIEKKLI